LIVGCYLYDTALGSELVRKGFEIQPADWRRAAHKCADAIYSRLSGEAPFFDSRVAYIAERGPKGNRIKRLRSEEHTSELQSLMRIPYAVFCLKTNNTGTN